MTATYRVEVLDLDRETLTTKLRLTKRDDDQLFPDATAAGCFLLVESASKAPSSTKDKVNVKLGKTVDARLTGAMERWLTEATGHYELFFELADSFVASFDMEDSGSSDGKPWMEYTLVASEPGLLAHLSKGSRWDSTCPEI